MESVKERMERLGAYEKIASFMQKEKQDYTLTATVGMHRRGYGLSSLSGVKNRIMRKGIKYEKDKNKN